MPAIDATKTSQRICCRSSPVALLKRWRTATTVESADTRAMTVPIVMSAGAISASPSTPRGFA